MKPLGFVVTFVAVTAAMIFFRTSTVASAIDLVKGVFGLNGSVLPHDATAMAATYGIDIKYAALWVAMLLFVALVCPNTLRILAPYKPALGVKPASTAPVIGKLRVPAWAPSLPWAVAVSAVAAIAIFRPGGPSEFLYWQF
jgi:alginate O-acetyltransferase complex protein AlgI